MLIAELVGDEHLWLKSIYIFLFFFRKWQIISLDKTLIPRLGSYRALWSCIEIAVWTFNPLATIEAYYMEKNLERFSSKTLISFRLKKERHEHLGWHVGEQIIRNFLFWKWTNPLRLKKDTQYIGTRGVTVHKIHGSVRYDTVVSRFGMFSIRGAGQLVTSQCWKYFCFKTWRRANGYHTSTRLHTCKLCARFMPVNVLISVNSL